MLHDSWINFKPTVLSMNCRHIPQLHNLTVHATACAQYFSLALTSSGWSPGQTQIKQLVRCTNLTVIKHDNSPPLSYHCKNKIPYVLVNFEMLMAWKVIAAQEKPARKAYKGLQRRAFLHKIFLQSSIYKYKSLFLIWLLMGRMTLTYMRGVVYQQI